MAHPTSTGAPKGPGRFTRGLVLAFTGIAVKVKERQAQIDGLIRRCNAIEKELSFWSDEWDTQRLREAGAAVQAGLNDMVQECHTIEEQATLQKIATDEYIQRALVRWDDALKRCLDDYNRSLLHEILASGQEVRALLFKQEQAIAALHYMSTTNENAEVRSQLQDFIEAGYVELRSENLSTADRDLIFESLRSLLTKDTVPASVQLKGELTIDRQFPIEVRNGSDISKGKWRNHVVAVKRLRDPNPTVKREGKFLCEGAIWRMLKHQNVQPFYGIHLETMENKTTIGLVSLWATNRDVLTFLRNYPESDRRSIVQETACGIAYLHRRKIVHGAIRGSNILIDQQGRAMLTDFGLAAASSTDHEALNDGLSTSETSTTIRWLAPELTGSIRVPIFPSDVFSFARTILEIMTGDKPFKEKKNVWELASLLNQGKLIPTRPDDPQVADRGLTNGVWELLLKMWETLPENRPTMRAVEARLEDLL